tara:strand:- start:94 stop:327 length:234 start_codon:yes stop_codon:yes gene_type:complete
MTNEQVIKAWHNGIAAKAGSLSTDGSNLYSYRLLIGKHSGGTIFNHTAPGGSYYSQTTSTHVNLAIRLSDFANIVTP